MSVHDNRRATVNKRVTEFGGIRSIARISDSGSSDMKNFRILPDGSLEKRCGFETVILGTKPIRGYWEGSFSGVDYIFYVAGNTLYRRSQNDASPVPLTALTASDNRVSFFLFHNSLYLLDGYTIMTFQPDSGIFSVAQGYVPLYGKDWDPKTLGEINEPRNLLNTRLRVHYLNSSASKVFQLPFTAQRVDSVRVNGTNVTSYTFQAGTSSVTIPDNYATGGEVVIAFEMDSLFSMRSTVLQANSAAIYRDGYHETLLTYGGSFGYRVWRSSEVSEEMLAGARVIYSSCDSLYVRDGTSFTLGSSEHPLTAAIQHLDRMLVFNDSGVWVLRHPHASDDSMEIVLYQDGIGCVARDGAVLCRGIPYIISGSGIAKLGLFSASSDITTLTVVSSDIADRLPVSVLKHCVLHWYDRDNRLWLRDTTDAEGTVLLCEPDGKRWVRYTGIAANALIDYGGGPGFTTANGRIARFDETLVADDGESFEAEYLSQYLDFSQPEFCKRAGYVSICADSGGASIGLTVESERRSCLLHFDGKEATPPEFFGVRFGIGRFRFLRYRLTVGGNARVRIYSLSATVTI